MAESTNCPLCARLDPTELIEWACLQDGSFVGGCVLQNKYGLKDREPQPEKIKDEESSGSSWNKIWKILTMMGIISGSTAGGWWMGSSDTTTGSEPTTVSSHNPIEIAQSCLQSGILDCAAHLFKVLSKDEKDSTEDNKIRVIAPQHKAVLTNETKDSLLQNEKSLLALAKTNLDYGRDCFAAKRYECAIKSSEIVLQNVEEGPESVKNIRHQAQDLKNDTQAALAEAQIVSTKISDKKVQPNVQHNNKAASPKANSKKAKESNPPLPKIIIR